MNYDVIIIGAGPGGIFTAYELTRLKPELKVAVFEAGHALNKRHCPIDGDKIKTCIGCKSCSIMSGFGGAGAFSDGKYNITNDFGGTLYEYIGKKRALELMHYVDEINMRYGGEGCKLYSTAGTRFKTQCIQHDLHLLDASVRHLGTDINYIVLENLYADLKDKVEFFFDTPVEAVTVMDENGQAIALDKEGGITKGVATAEELGKLGRYVEKILERITREMSEGNINADPCGRGEKDNACVYCEFASACHFMDMDEEDHMEIIRTIKPEEFWTHVDTVIGEETNG